MRRLTALGLLGIVASAAHADAARAGTEAPVGQAVAASRTARTVLYLELLGNGGLFSFNAERFFAHDVSGRVGLAFLPVISIDAGGGGLATIVPVLVNYSGIGSLNHKLELGAGAAFVIPKGSVLATATVGYRYLPHDGGFTFKIAFTPLLGPRGFLPWGGIGLGASF